MTKEQINLVLEGIESVEAILHQYRFMTLNDIYAFYAIPVCRKIKELKIRLTSQVVDDENNQLQEM